MPMIELSFYSFQFTILPVIAAQLFLVVLVYFSTVSRHILVGYRYHACCLICLTAYLSGRVLQSYFDEQSSLMILYFRVMVLFCLGIPSMLVATALQVGEKISSNKRNLVYLFGCLSAMFYVVTVDSAWHKLILGERALSLLPYTPSVRMAEMAVVFYMAVFLVLPCLYFVYKQIKKDRHPIAFAFLAGSLVFGFSHLFIMLFERGYWSIYIGAIVTAFMWCWAVYQDIRETKGRAELLKEELQLVVRSGKGQLKPDIESLLIQLEELADGNIAHYKLKVREILNRLTDSTIEAGGDVESLLSRNAQKIEAIKKSESSQEIREIASKEAVELSGLIADIPGKRINETVEKIKSYIDENYQTDIEIDELADKFAVSRSHLMRSFKKHVDKTINQYVTNVRVKQAKVLLLQSSVTDTAFAVGFNNSNYFSTVFKKETGMTPGQYVQSLNVQSLTDTQSSSSGSAD